MDSYVVARGFEYKVRKVPGNNQTWEGLVLLTGVTLLSTREIGAKDNFEAMFKLQERFARKMIQALRN